MPIFERIVSTTIEIAAAPMDVWTVLTDLSRYPLWNPHIREGTGIVAVGKRLTLRMYPPKSSPITVHPTVVVAEPGVEWRLRARVPGLFRSEHYFTLQAANSGTRLTQGEIYSGVIVPLIGATIAMSARSFQEHNQALKRQVEAREHMSMPV